MAENSAQQPTGELKPAPAVNRRAFSQDNMQEQALRPQRHWSRAREERVIRFLAGLLCLGAASFSLWYWRDPLWCVLFFGMATGAISPKDVVGTMLRRRANQNDELNE